MRTRMEGEAAELGRTPAPLRIRAVRAAGVAGMRTLTTVAVAVVMAEVLPTADRRMRLPSFEADGTATSPSPSPARSSDPSKIERSEI
ncbi:hypothetical protein EH165_05300 [Nakamurella antarctica]|uniref:Uncharacterized protein n=1 Tax=Nakamurella antarctica TaxID=1902245 RepID=A0A3G8ZLE5_9ACTN|nr:hypothetical protein [Nakamurella antarctica]AZI57655.1 hypothetical protein EH165_05300 [Nakamurella antarctica]